MSGQNKGFRHYRDGFLGLTLTHGGVTMAFDAPAHIDDLTASDNVKVAFSVCSTDDVFCRKTGRDIATERLETASYVVNGKAFINILRANCVESLHNTIGVLGQLGIWNDDGLAERKISRSFM